MAGNVKDWWNASADNDRGSVPDFMPEGKTPIASVNEWSRESQAAVRLFYENMSWRDMGHTVNYVSDSSFEVNGGTGDGDISLYHVGQRVQMATTVDPTDYFYGTISAIDTGVSPPVVTTTEATVPVGVGHVALGIDPTGQPITTAAFTGAAFAKLDQDNLYTLDSNNQYFPATGNTFSFDAAGAATTDISKYRYTPQQSVTSWRRFANYYNNGAANVHYTNTDYPTELLQFSDASGQVRMQVADPATAGSEVTWKYGLRVHSAAGSQILVDGSWRNIDYGGSLGTGTQEWKDKTSSRSLGTTFTNGTTQPIQVNVGVLVAQTGVSSAAAYVGVATPNIQVWTMSEDSGGSRGTVSFIVPAGNRYQVTASSGTVYFWSELTTG